MTQLELGFDDDITPVEKAVVGNYSVEQSTYYGNRFNDADRRKRGLSVYNYSALVSQAARDRYGQIQSAEYLIPYFSLTISERIDMARACGPIFGVVTGRMNTISGLDWKVTRKSKEEDRIAQQLKFAKQLLDERQEGETGPASGTPPQQGGMQMGMPITPPVQSPSLASMKQKYENKGVVLRCKQFIKSHLIDVLDDMSNFDRAMLRWSTRLKTGHEDVCSEIEDWMRHPNLQDTFEDFVKKLIFDEHVHGLAVPYKKVIDRKIQQLYVLPGGCCFPIHGRHVGDAHGVIQIIDGAEAQLFYSDEVSVLQYAVYSGDPYGLVPLEALVNKVAEVLLFDERAAAMADGTRPPEKLVVFGENTPWGNLQNAFEMPMNKGEEKRMETLINEWRKEAVRVISGHGTPAVVDISRSDTFQHQSERQRMVREEVGLVFGASNTELNLTGSESTSGRNSAKSQENKDHMKGIQPHIITLENFWNRDVFPYRCGEGYEFAYEAGLTDQEKMEVWTSMIQSGLYSVNEIRTEEMGKAPFEAETKNPYDAPQGAGQSQQFQQQGGMMPMEGGVM